VWRRGSDVRIEKIGAVCAFPGDPAWLTPKEKGNVRPRDHRATKGYFRMVLIWRRGVEKSSRAEAQRRGEDAEKMLAEL
jgi:hypothetical protein